MIYILTKQCVLAGGGARPTLRSQDTTTRRVHNGHLPRLTSRSSTGQSIVQDMFPFFLDSHRMSQSGGDSRFMKQRNKARVMLDRGVKVST